MTFSKSKLPVINNIHSCEKAIKSTINNFFKFFCKNWDYRYWSIVIKQLRIAFLKNCSNFSSF